MRPQPPKHIRKDALRSTFWRRCRPCWVHDGFLDKKDLKKYALSEFKFTLPDPVADKIIKHLTAPGAKGVAKDDFQRIKVQIGIARDRQIDLQRKKRMDELKDQLQDRIEKEVKTGVDEITTLNASIEARLLVSGALGSPWKVAVGKAWGATGGFWAKQWLDYWEDE
eukprot:s2051_g12.t1